MVHPSSGVVEEEEGEEVLVHVEYESEVEGLCMDCE